MNIKIIFVLFLTAIMYLFFANPSSFEGGCQIFSFSHTVVEVVQMDGVQSPIYFREMVFYTTHGYEFFRLPLSGDQEYRDLYFENGTLVERCSDGVKIWLKPLALTKT